MSYAMSVLMAVLSGASIALLGLVYKTAQTRRCRGAAFTTVFCLVAGVLALAAALVEGTTWGDWRLWAIGLMMGVSLFGALMLVVPMYALGPASISWMFMNLGLLGPILVSSLAFGETMYWLDLGLLGLFLVMLLVVAWSMRGPQTRGSTGVPPVAPCGTAETAVLHRRTDGTTTNGTPNPDAMSGLVTPVPRYMLLLGAEFVLGAVFMSGQKAKFHEFGHANSPGLMAIFYLTCASLSWLTGGVMGRGQPIQAKEWKMGLLAGLASAAGQILVLAAMDLPAVVVYPITCGLSLVGGMALTAVFYKERFGGLKLAALALGLAVFLGACMRDGVVSWLSFLHANPVLIPGR